MTTTNRFTRAGLGSVLCVALAVLGVGCGDDATDDGGASAARRAERTFAERVRSRLPEFASGYSDADLEW